jgi:predicted enzyme related to lactoylglutathione lyase
MTEITRTIPQLLRVAPEVPVADLDAAVAYYVEKLGFALAMTLPEHDYAIVERDGVALHLFVDKANNHSPASFHIFTNGLEELLVELQRRGTTIRQGIVPKPWGNRDFRVSDASGNEIKFTEASQGS